MIDYKAINSNIIQGVRNGAFKRLRKRNWTNGSIYSGVTEVNSYLCNKYVVYKGCIYYQFRFDIKTGRVVGQEGEYIFQQISCERDLFEDNSPIIESGKSLIV